MLRTKQTFVPVNPGIENNLGIKIVVEVIRNPGVSGQKLLIFLLKSSQYLHKFRINKFIY